MVDAVTSDDLDSAVQLAVAALRDAPEGGWDTKAGTLEWDCWETAEHLSNALFTYSTRLGRRSPPVENAVPFVRESRRPDGPANIVHVDREAGPAGLLRVLEACGELLVAMVRCAPPDVRGHHVNGVSDPEGFAAMGIVETFVHTQDLAEGLGLTWEPPAGPCSRALRRLFPDAPRDTEPWPTLLWATGRGELPGRARLTSWRWYAAVRT